MIGAQMLTLISQQPSLVVRGLRGTTPPVAVGGFGGWSLVARPRRKSLTQWQGIDPFQMQLSLIFDGLDGDASVEGACTSLERMAQPPGLHTPPPRIRVVGAVPHPEFTYVIGDGNGGPGLAWDANPDYSPSGYRIRQEVTVTLIEYVADDRVAAVPASTRARQKSSSASARAAASAGGHTAGAHSYTVKTGDSLVTVASRELGSAQRWTEIAQLNNLFDPDQITVGQTLRMP